MVKSKQIILGVTGSIAAYKACEIINQLKKRRCNVTCVLTKEAEEFITPLTLQTLSGNQVIRGMFSLPQEFNPAHICLARQAKLVLIAPASANIIAKLAAGLADDTLSALTLSTRAPVILCPAMNERMFTHKITQENIARLKKIGYRILGPIKGHLVCGDQGLGHLADVADIVREAMKILH
ncbi:MAG: phosphopantothenoylcysteine decarboxylase [Candidatus Omnitrophica bacterium]|nr:phosphopantothenoylcysteine decarboxylase [Candidatus Omnitrophota bacterium]